MTDNPYMKGANPFMPSSPMDAAQSVGADNDVLTDMAGDMPDLNGYGVGESTKPRQMPGGASTAPPMVGGGMDQMGVPQQPMSSTSTGAKMDLGAYFASLQVVGDFTHDGYSRARAAWHSYKGKKTEAPIGNNTSTWQDEHGNQHVKLHNTNVVSYSPGGKHVTFRNGGWATPTTHSRHREHGPAGYFTYKDKGVAHVSTPKGEKHPFEEGISFDTTTHERLPNHHVKEGAPTPPPGTAKAPSKPKAAPKPKPQPGSGESFKDFLKRLSTKESGLVVQRRPAESAVDPELADHLLALAEEHAVGRGHDVRGWEPHEGGNVASCQNCPATVQMHHSEHGGLYGGSAVREDCPNSTHKPYVSPVAAKVAEIAAQARKSNPLLTEESARRIARKTIVTYPALVKSADSLNPLDFGIGKSPDGPMLGEQKAEGRPRPQRTPSLPGGAPSMPGVPGGAAAPAADAAGVAGAAGAGEGAAAAAAAGAGEAAAAGAGLAEVAPLLAAL